MLPSIGRLKPAVISGFTLLSQCSHRIFSTLLQHYPAKWVSLGYRFYSGYFVCKVSQKRKLYFGLFKGIF